MRKEELLKEIERCEKEKKFSENVCPPNYDEMLPVSNDYDYLRKGFFKKFGSFISVGLFKLLGLFIAPYCHLKIVGKENFKGIKNAILTCNHINNIDCVLIKRALPHHKLKITVANFNNKKGLLGSLLRGGGTMPFGDTLTTQKNLSLAIKTLLKENNYILFYPEGSLWWCYEKPRPLIDGAYFFATKSNVPIIPMFFTFKEMKKKKNGIPKKKFILNIGKPIFPQENLSSKENINFLKSKNFEWNKELYESFYNKKLEYLEK